MLECTEEVLSSGFYSQGNVGMYRRGALFGFYSQGLAAAPQLLCVTKCIWLLRVACRFCTGDFSTMADFYDQADTSECLGLPFCNEMNKVGCRLCIVFRSCLWLRPERVHGGTVISPCFQSLDFYRPCRARYCFCILLWMDYDHLGWPSAFWLPPAFISIRVSWFLSARASDFTSAILSVCATLASIISIWSFSSHHSDFL